MNKSERNKLFIGIGIGLAVGGGTGYFIAEKRTKKKHREEMRKARRKAYLDGIEDGKDPVQLKNAYLDGVEEGLTDGKRYIDNLKKVLTDEGMKSTVEKVDQIIAEEDEQKSNVILNDFPEGCNAGWIRISDTEIAFFEKKDNQTVKLLEDENGKAVKYPLSIVIGDDGNVLDDSTLADNFARFEKNPVILKEVMRISGLTEPEKEPEIIPEKIHNEGNTNNVNEKPVIDHPPVKTIGTAKYDQANHQVIFLGAAGTRLAYPETLFIGRDGEVLDSIDIRNNIRKHEHNLARLNLIWNQMGWGAYIPDLDNDVTEGNVSAEDIDNWDLSLDGEANEPMEKIIERERYLDEVEKYKAHPEEAPRIISRRDFSEEAYLEKTYVDFYDVDNVFVESTDGDRVLDAYDYFGVTNGNDLFRMKRGTEDDDDPDIVHVKSFRMNCVMEVTRWHKSYGSVKDGGAYISGNTD